MVKFEVVAENHTGFKSSYSLSSFCYVRVLSLMQRLQNEKLLWTLSRKLLKSVFGNCIGFYSAPRSLHEQTVPLRTGLGYFKRRLFTVSINKQESYKNILLA